MMALNSPGHHWQKYNTMLYQYYQKIGHKYLYKQSANKHLESVFSTYIFVSIQIEAMFLSTLPAYDPNFKSQTSQKISRLLIVIYSLLTCKLTQMCIFPLTGSISLCYDVFNSIGSLFTCVLYYYILFSNKMPHHIWAWQAFTYSWLTGSSARCVLVNSVFHSQTFVTIPNHLFKTPKIMS